MMLANEIAYDGAAGISGGRMSREFHAKGRAGIPVIHHGEFQDVPTVHAGYGS